MAQWRSDAEGDHEPGRRPGGEENAPATERFTDDRLSAGALSLAGAAEPSHTHRSATAIPSSPALTTDLYQLTMAEAYLRAGITGRATFSLFVRRLPPERHYLVAAGLESALAYLEELHFADDDLAFLAGTGRFSATLLAFLAGLRFTGDVRAIPEGRAVFAEEPLLEVTAPIIEAQLVETFLINTLHLHTLLASKAARCADAAGGRAVIDFGLRRAHGVDAGMAAARAAYLAGCSATSNVAAGQAYAIPISGTMAHSFIMAFPSEIEAFRAYTSAYPDGAAVLIDTYDVLQGARNAATVAHELRSRGQRLGGVRIDSGDLGALSRQVRALLDADGFPEVQIVVSGNLDEYGIAALLAGDAPIDGFGVGTRMVTSADAPTLEMAYKLVEYEGRPVAKRSAGKSSWPAAKQVWRRSGPDGRYLGDTIALVGEAAAGEPLLKPVMQNGSRREPAEPLAAIRGRWLAEREALPPWLRTPAGEEPYPVTFAPALQAVAGIGV